MSGRRLNARARSESPARARLAEWNGLVAGDEVQVLGEGRARFIFLAARPRREDGVVDEVDLYGGRARGKAQYSKTRTFRPERLIIPPAKKLAAARAARLERESGE